MVPHGGVTIYWALTGCQEFYALDSPEQQPLFLFRFHRWGDCSLVCLSCPYPGSGRAEVHTLFSRASAPLCSPLGHAVYWKLCWADAHFGLVHLYLSIPLCNVQAVGLDNIAGCWVVNSLLSGKHGNAVFLGLWSDPISVARSAGGSTLGHISSSFGSSVTSG